jgi:hypothetical protein
MLHRTCVRLRIHSGGLPRSSAQSVPGEFCGPRFGIPSPLSISSVSSSDRPPLPDDASKSQPRLPRRKPRRSGRTTWNPRPRLHAVSSGEVLSGSKEVAGPHLGDFVSACNCEESRGRGRTNLQALSFQRYGRGLSRINRSRRIGGDDGLGDGKHRRRYACC